MKPALILVPRSVTGLIYVISSRARFCVWLGVVVISKARSSGAPPDVGQVLRTMVGTSDHRGLKTVQRRAILQSDTEHLLHRHVRAWPVPPGHAQAWWFDPFRQT